MLIDTSYNFIYYNIIISNNILKAINIRATIFYRIALGKLNLVIFEIYQCCKYSILY